MSAFCKPIETSKHPERAGAYPSRVTEKEGGERSECEERAPDFESPLIFENELALRVVLRAGSYSLFMQVLFWSYSYFFACSFYVVCRQLLCVLSPPHRGAYAICVCVSVQISVLLPPPSLLISLLCACFAHPHCVHVCLFRDSFLLPLPPSLSSLHTVYSSTPPIPPLPSLPSLRPPPSTVLHSMIIYI